LALSLYNIEANNIE